MLPKHTNCKITYITSEKKHSDILGTDQILYTTLYNNNIVIPPINILNINNNIQETFMGRC